MIDPLLSLLIAIADGAAPLPTERVNVRRTCYEPMLRLLTSVHWEDRKGERWLRWEWRPEPREDGRPDCGYSAINLSIFRVIE